MLYPESSTRVAEHHTKINAEGPFGVSDQIKCAVSEYAARLKFKSKTWERNNSIDTPF